MTGKEFNLLLMTLAANGVDPGGMFAKEARERAAIAVRICVKYTPPGDGKKTPKQAAKTLRERIAWNILGDTGKPVTALVIRDRQGQLRQIDRSHLGGIMPFVVAKEGSSSLVKYQDPLKWLSGNTRFLRHKDKAERHVNGATGPVYVKGAALRRAVKTLQKRAGFTLSGWLPAARYCGARIANQLPDLGAPGHAAIERDSQFGWYTYIENNAVERFQLAPIRASRTVALPDVTYREFTLACAKRARNIQKSIERQLKK